MSYLGSYAMDDVCTFYANTHTPSTGAAVDADTPPDYRVYEEVTGTPILTGTMALLDAANTAGFYSGQVTLTAANGFEVGKGYAIRIALVVGGATGVDMQRLQVGAKVDVRLLGGNVQSAVDLQDFADAGYDPATNALSDVRLAQLDAAVSSRSTYAGGAVASVTASVTVGTNTDKTGYTLSAAGITALWAALTAGLTTVGSVGKLLVDQLNATIASRSSHAAADVWGVATRLLTAGTNIVLAKGTGLTGLNDPTPAALADQVWDEVLAGHLTAGTTGAALNGASSAGDPWTTALPGAYGAGTAGQLVGANLNATMASRASQASVDGVDARLPAALVSGRMDSSVGAYPGNTPQSGDVFPLVDDTKTQADRIEADTQDIQSRLPNNLIGGRMESHLGDTANNVLTSQTLHASAVALLQNGLSTLDAADVRGAVGLATANLDTQLAAIAGLLDTEIAVLLATTADIQAKTDTLPPLPAAVGSTMTLAPGALTATVLAGDALQAIATALKTLVVEQEGGLTLGQILSLLLAALVGLTTDGGATFRTPNGQAVRIQGTVNGLNERVTMALSPSS